MTVPPSATSNERMALRTAIRDYISDRSPMAVTRKLVSSGAGYDGALWASMADQLGLPALTVPERWGGAGLSTVELSVVLEELGRALVMTPCLSVALAVEMLVRSGDEDICGQVLPGVAAGSMTAAVVMGPDSGYFTPAGVSIKASRSGDDWRLDGVSPGVVDGFSADLLIVAAAGADGLGVYLVRASRPEVLRRRLDGLDLTREMAHLEFRAAPARAIRLRTEAGTLLRQVRDRALVAYVAEMAGVTRQCLEMAVAYAKTREQFGRPIGSFQAIKHKCAQMLVAAESIEAALWAVSRLAATDSPDLPLAAAVAKSYASDQCFRAAAENIQIHGGIGYTWEHDAHLYFRRAKALQLLGGTAAAHRAWIAEQIGL